uniref:Uncharacterized protein n=1 Tax=Anopheles funestus TaxID=62324 RepID=A0A182S354_ANOFN
MATSTKYHITIVCCQLCCDESNSMRYLLLAAGKLMHSQVTGDLTVTFAI